MRKKGICLPDKFLAEKIKRGNLQNSAQKKDRNFANKILFWKRNPCKCKWKNDSKKQKRNISCEKQKRHFYGAIINVLHLHDGGSPFVDATIQTLINEILGSNKLFGYQAEVLTIVSNLEKARVDSTQFRKCILDAANLVDTLKGGGSNVWGL